MIILDTNSLVRMVLIDKDHDDAARFRGLLQKAKDSGISVGIPAPVFGEFLVRSDDATTDVLALFERQRSIKVLPFDKRAAHECAMIERAILNSGKGKKLGSKDAWQKLKIDRQIIAIARVHNAQLIISSDSSLKALSNRIGLRVEKVGDLPIPEDAKQRSLELLAGEGEDK